MNISTAINHLERAALDAYRHGDTWTMFWEQHGAEVCRAEPHDRQRFVRLVRRLLALLVSGNDDGLHAVGDDDGLPSEIGIAQLEQAGPHDSKADARCLLPMVAFSPAGAVE